MNENELFECTQNNNQQALLKHTNNDFKDMIIHFTKESTSQYLSSINSFTTKFINIVQKKLSKYTKDIGNLTSKLKNIVESRNLANKKIFEELFQKQKLIYYLYNEIFEVVPFEPMIKNEKLQRIKTEDKNNITEDFLKGFKNE